MTEAREFSGEPATDLTLEVAAGRAWDAAMRTNRDRWFVSLLDGQTAEGEGIVLATFTSARDATAYAISMSSLLAASFPLAARPLEARQ